MPSPHFTLDQLDPRARLWVVTDIKNSESAFTDGASLRQQWESSRIQHVYETPTPVSVNENPWLRCSCPNGTTIFIKFMGDEFRLLDASSPTSPDSDNSNMQPKKKTPPPRKGAAPKSAAPVASSTETKPAAPTAPVAPVAAPKGKSAKSQAARKDPLLVEPAPTGTEHNFYVLGFLKTAVSFTFGIAKPTMDGINNVKALREFVIRSKAATAEQFNAELERMVDCKYTDRKVG